LGERASGEHTYTAQNLPWRAVQVTQCSASVAQNKRIGACHPQRPVHIILVLVQDALFGAHKTQGVLKKGIVVYYQMNCYSI
jgi:hypothetical protein